MAEIRPLRGWRYDLAQVGDLSDVTAPPYDVISPAQQDEFYKQHPCNVIRLILNRNEPGDASPDDRYARAAHFLKRWKQEGVLMQESEEALYVYHQEFHWEGVDYVRKGFLGRIRLEKFGDGCVFPHEQTLSGPKADRLKLTQACHANLSPIFGLFPDPESQAQDLLDKRVRGLTPLVAVDHLGVVHRMWPVTEPGLINQVREILREKPIFIADGHHRYETALNYRNWLSEEGRLGGTETGPNFVLMMFVGMSDPGLQILPTHRLISGWPAMQIEEIQEALAGHFEFDALPNGPRGAQDAWELIAADGGQNVFGLGTTADGRWLFARVTDASPMAQLAPQQSPAWRALGVSLLHKLIVEHLLARRWTAPPQFTYVHSLEEVQAAQQSGACQLACLVPPAQINDVEEIAASGEKMPPKSTYFYPKLHSGLVINALD